MRQKQIKLANKETSDADGTDAMVDDDDDDDDDDVCVCLTESDHLKSA